jgi:hypothetical protein
MVHPAELSEPNDLAFADSGKRRLGDVSLTCETARCELFEGAGTHGNVSVIWHVGHRLAEQLPNASGKLRSLGEVRDRDVLRQVKRRARTAVED